MSDRKSETPLPIALLLMPLLMGRVYGRVLAERFSIDVCRGHWSADHRLYGVIVTTGIWKQVFIGVRRYDRR